MPLSKGCSVRSFRNNVAKLVREGRPNDQAVAAAYRTLRDSCKKMGKKMPDIGEIVPYPEDMEADEVMAIIETVIASEKEECCGRPTTVWGLYDLKKDD